MEFWIKAGQLLLALSILIVVHEFGHYLPAKWFKTRVEKFYLFFDYKFSLLKKKIGDTEWGIGWIPLGGYVKIAGMIDESMDKEQMAKEPQPWEFRSKPTWQRLIIMLGGVTVNVIVGFLIYIMVLFVWGEEKIDNSKLVNGVAVHPFFEQYGFKSGDIIQEVDGKKVDNFSKLGAEILIFGKTKFKVQHEDGKIETIKLPANIDDKMFESGAMNAFSFRAFPGKIKEVQKESIASKSGLKAGDKILAVNDQKFNFHDEMQSALYKNRGKKIEVLIERKNKEFVKTIKLDETGLLGYTPDVKLSSDTNAIYTKNYSFGESFSNGFSLGGKTLYMNVYQFKFLATKKGATSLGGFGSIGKMFSPTWDWRSFWMLTALLSFGLAVMNLLPIPALDGGHVMFLIYEMITGRPPAQRFLEIAQTIGFVIILGLILFANGKDIYNAIFG
ncbi:MAG: RIP metalloprotease RseP [Fluviicola sp.]|jgi:regulator of sigma E protease